MKAINLYIQREWKKASGAPQQPSEDHLQKNQSVVVSVNHQQGVWNRLATACWHHVKSWALPHTVERM